MLLLPHTAGHTRKRSTALKKSGHETDSLESRIAASNESNPWPLEVHGLIESPPMKPFGCLVYMVFLQMVPGIH